MTAMGSSQKCFNGLAYFHSAYSTTQGKASQLLRMLTEVCGTCQSMSGGHLALPWEPLHISLAQSAAA